MGLKDFRIVFDNQWKTYYSGQTVTGNIVIVLDSIKKIRGICVKIKGEASVCLLEQEEDEKLFEKKYYLVGSASGGEIVIQSGEHKFPFTFSLPTNLPSSFEYEMGHIRYTIRAILDRPWKFDQEVKSLFTVIAPLDLNKEPRAAEPVREEISKTFWDLCCTPPLTVKFSLPVRGYVPGQSIPIKINVENLSNVVVNRIRLVLCKVVTFHVNKSRDNITMEIVVSEISNGSVEPGGTADYEQRLKIPPLPPSNLANCNIIDLEYNLKVQACFEEWYYRNLSTNTLIFVGTIPLALYHAPSAPPNETNGDNSTNPSEIGFVIPSANTALPPLPEFNSYPNLPSPFYEESLTGARNLHERGESQYVYGLSDYFAPRYPVYNFVPAQ